MIKIHPMTFKGLQEKYNFPNQIKVQIKKNKYGFTASLPDYPGCITRGDSLNDLIENVNDAFLTYLEIPREEASKIKPIYFPSLEKNENKNQTSAPLSFFPLPPRLYG